MKRQGITRYADFVGGLLGAGRGDLGKTGGAVVPKTAPQEGGAMTR
ncbi:MAG: hypothetical protein K2R93_21395 [Gemmatimonadaceae bacterium]|nr:hypothetical protein [Gemmatimonadaceae bacterium]